MSDEITRCRHILIQTSGSSGAFFRPSGTRNGIDSPSSAVLLAAGAAGYPTVVGYDVDPMDYKDPGSATVVHRVIAGLHPGAVVSLHFGHPGTIEALPAILDGIASVAAASIPGRRVGHQSSLRPRVVLGRRCQDRRANTDQSAEVEHDHCCLRQPRLRQIRPTSTQAPTPNGSPPL